MPMARRVGEALAATSDPAVLVVDDNDGKRLAVIAAIEQLGLTTIEAASGEDALRAVLKRNFAVILMDVQMPRMSGYEAARLIRTRAESEHTPIIFVTAFSDEMNTAQGYSLGAVDYILTPVVPEILRTKVGVFVDLYKKTQQVKQ